MSTQVKEWDFEAGVEVRFAEDLTFDEVSPLLDALAKTPIFTVRASRYGWSGPAAGGPEVGLVVVAVAAVGGAAFAKSFCEELGKDAYRAVRTAIISIAKRLRAREPEARRAIVPLVIEVGNVRICFGSTLDEQLTSDEWSDEWLVERLRQAQAIVNVQSALGSEVAGILEGVETDPCEHWLR